MRNYHAKPEVRAKYVKYRATDNGKRMAKAGSLRAKYSLTLENFNQILAQQNNSCAICFTKNAGGKGTFHVDHNHVSGRLRGLLCHNCNLGLGHFKDNPNLLSVAIKYLQERA